MGYCPTVIFGGGTWDAIHNSERASWYNTTKLYTAWGLLIEAAKGQECGDHLSDAFVFDLVDVGREYLSVVPCMKWYNALAAASTPAAVHAANASMAEFMSDLDRLLGASAGFLLGQWIGDARRIAATHEAADFLEWNARAQVTSWFPASTPAACNGTATATNPLYDYGNKAWSGLVKGYYDKRYQIYAQSKICRIDPTAVTVEGLTCEGFNYVGQLVKLACDFQHLTGPVPTMATGNALAISEELWTKYAP